MPGHAVRGTVLACELDVEVAAAFAVNALSFLAFLVALARIRLDPEESFVNRAGKGTLAEQIVEGVRYTAAHPGIGPLLALYFAYALCARPLIEMLPGFAAEVFGRGAGALAMLTSAIGVGAVAAGLVLARRGDARGLTRATPSSVLGLVLAIPAFVSTDNFVTALVAVTVVGFCMVSTGVGTQTLVQLSVAPSMRGRVLGLHGILFRGGAGLGALLIGLISEGAGLRWSFAGAMAVLLVAWLWVSRRRAPSALRRPISPIRSRTPINMTLAITIAATSRAIPAVAGRYTVSTRLAFLTAFWTWVGVKMEKSSGSSSARPCRTCKIPAICSTVSPCRIPPSRTGCAVSGSDGTNAPARP